MRSNAGLAFLNLTCRSRSFVSTIFFSYLSLAPCNYRFAMCHWFEVTAFFAKLQTRLGPKIEFHFSLSKMYLSVSFCLNWANCYLPHLVPQMCIFGDCWIELQHDWQHHHHDHHHLNDQHFVRLQFSFQLTYITKKEREKVITFSRLSAWLTFPSTSTALWPRGTLCEHRCLTNVNCKWSLWSKWSLFSSRKLTCPLIACQLSLIVFVFLASLDFTSQQCSCLSASLAFVITFSLCFSCTIWPSHEFLKVPFSFPNDCALDNYSWDPQLLLLFYTFWQVTFDSEVCYWGDQIGWVVGKVDK